MSLRNLLPIGRAFIPAGGNSGRYRPAEAGVMPVFSGPQGVRVRPAAAVGLETAVESSAGSLTAAAAAVAVASAAPEAVSAVSAVSSAVVVPIPEPDFEAAAPSPATGPSLNLFAKRSVEAVLVATPPIESAPAPAPEQGAKAEKEREQQKISVERSLSRPPPAPVAKVTGAGDRSGGRVWRLPVWVEQVLSSLVRPGNRRRGTRPVQTEMTFERVRVARNDLMTADVEVVSVGSGASGRPARLSAACRARLLRLWWGQGSERWKRLGNVFRKS